MLCTFTCFFFKSDEWLQSYDPKCINMYNLDGGVHWQIVSVSNFFKSFHTNPAKNDPQLQIWPKKWGHFDPI